jgi:hypothetical protein
VDFDIDKIRYGWHIDVSRYEQRRPRNTEDPVYDLIASWMTAGGPLEAHDPNERMRATHSSEGSRRDAARRLPRWIRPVRRSPATAMLVDCCAVA